MICDEAVGQKINAYAVATTTVESVHADGDIANDREGVHIRLEIDGAGGLHAGEGIEGIARFRAASAGAVEEAASFDQQILAVDHGNSVAVVGIDAVEHAVRHAHPAIVALHVPDRR